MNGIFTREESVHLSYDEFIHYYSYGLVPAPTPDQLDRIFHRLKKQNQDDIDTLQAEIDEARSREERTADKHEEEVTRLLTESAQLKDRIAAATKALRGEK